MSSSKSPRTKAFEGLRRLTEGVVDLDALLPPELTLLNEPSAKPSKNYLDRSSALIAAALLERALESALLTHFVKLDPESHRNLFSQDSESPLSTFAAKVRIAYALGVFGPDARDDLICIKNIRNAFAHATDHLEFDSPVIAAACHQIKLPKKPTWEHMVGEKTPRRQFILTAKLLYTYLACEAGDPPLRYQESSWSEEIIS